MRRLPLAAAPLLVLVLALPAPALAQDDRASPSGSLEQLADPATQQQMAMMARALGEILLDMPVAPLLDAAAQITGEDVTGIDRDARVADLVGPQARAAPEEMAERLPQMMGAMATLAGTLEALAPQLRDMAERMGRAASTSE